MDREEMIRAGAEAMHAAFRRARWAYVEDMDDKGGALVDGIVDLHEAAAA